MNEWYVGQEVVCIEDISKEPEAHTLQGQIPEINRVYAILDVKPFDFKDKQSFIGLKVFDDGPGMEIHWNDEFFQPLAETRLAELRKLCNPTPVKTPELV